MRSTLNDVTVLHDDNLIGIFDRAESMSDNDDSLLSTLNKLVKSLLHRMFTLCIQG